MLNPDQAARLRKLVESKAEVTHFEGFRIERCCLEVQEENSNVNVIADELGTDGTMRAPDRIFGVPFNGECLNGIGNHTVRAQRKLLYRYRNAKLTGNNAVIGDFGLAAPAPIKPGPALARLCSSTQPNFLGFVLNREEDSDLIYAYFVSGVQKAKMPGTAMFFHNVEPGNYGSFLFRVLPQILFVAAHKEVKFDFYITPGRSSWFIEAVRYAGLPELPIFTVGELAGEAFESLLMCNDFDNEGWFDAQTLSRISQMRERVVQSSSSTFKSFGVHLYVSRQLAGGYRPNYRRLLNEEEVAQLATANGFEIIFPETLSFSNQVAAFSSAETIVGPSGSGMLNAVFAPAQTLVLDIESFHFTVRQHAKIYSSTGKLYSFIFGTIPGLPDSPAFSNWTLDLDLFAEALGELHGSTISSIVPR